MLMGWIDLVRRPLTKRNDFVSIDARGYSTSPKGYEMMTSPPTTTSEMPKIPDQIVTTPRSEHDEGSSPVSQSPPSPSSQYTNDYYFHKEPDSKIQHQPSFSPPPQEADYKCPKLSFSTPRPPSAGRSFSRDSYGRPYQPQTGRTSPGRPFSSSTRRESGGSTFSSAYDWDPATTYAPPSTQIPSYSRPDPCRV